MENKKSYYAVIPANVRHDDRLAFGARLLYSEIAALCNERGYCWASNKYFADLYKVTDRTIRSWISSLVTNGYIVLELIYRENSKEVEARYLKINNRSTVDSASSTEKNISAPTEACFLDKYTGSRFPNLAEADFRKVGIKTPNPTEACFLENNKFNNKKNIINNNSIITNRNNTGESPLELDSNFINNSNSINTNKNNLTWTKNKQLEKNENNSNNDNNENYEDEPRKTKNCTLIASKIGENNKLSGADPAEAHKNRTKLQEARVQKSVSQEVYKYKRRKKQLQKVTESFLEKHSMESDRLVSLLDDYVDMFFESFFNISNQTWRMKLDKLFSISSDVGVLETCVSKAIENGWKNFFESKEDWSTSQGKTLDKRHASSLYEDKNAYVDLDHSLARNADGSLMMF